MRTRQKKYDFDRVVRLVLTIINVAVAVFVINYLSGVLLPFLVGCILAYILNPLVEFFMRVFRTQKRFFPVILAVVVFFGVLFIVLRTLIPYMINEFIEMGKLLAAYAQSELRVPYVPDAVHEFLARHVDMEHIQDLFTREQWMRIVNTIAAGTWSFVGGTLRLILTIVSWLLSLLYMFFVLLDYDRITRSFKAAIPPRFRRTAFKVMNDVENTMQRYFRGQALVSLFVGIIFAIEFYIIGLPMAIVFGLSIGVLNMVPYLQLISIPAAAFLCLVASVATGGSFWVLFGWTIAAYCICQAIQDLVLIPIIMRQQMGLNPAVVFLALSVWSYVLGFVGLLIALPLTTLIISYYCEYVLKQPNPLYAHHKGRYQVKIAKAVEKERKKIAKRRKKRHDKIVAHLRKAKQSFDNIYNKTEKEI